MQKSTVRSGLVVILPLLLGGAPILSALGFFAFTDISNAASNDPFRFNILFQVAVLLGAMLLGFSSNEMPRNQSLAYILLVVFLGSAVLGLALTSIDPAFGVLSLTFRLFNLPLALLLIFLISRLEPTFSARLLFALVIGFSLHAILIVATTPFMPPEPHYLFLNGPPGIFQVRLWGMVLVGVIGAGIGLTLQSQGRERALLWMALILLTAAMFWSGTRASVLSLPGSAIFGLLVLPRVTTKLLPVMIGTFIAGAGLSLLLEAPAPSWGMLNSYVETVTASGADALSAGRISLWKETVRLISEAPLFGHGFDHFRWLDQASETNFVHPHNSPLHILVSFGLIGGTALILLILMFWIQSIRNVRSNPSPVMTGAFFGLNGLLIFSLVDAVFYHVDTLILLAVFFAILLANPPYRQHEQG